MRSAFNDAYAIFSDFLYKNMFLERSTVNSLYTHILYNDKICNDDNFNVTKPWLKT